ncbi:MAG: undecaprenyl/decaprenyl-phosphate alpha-N-acetylglucosaminyl 1-phosphate transferase [Prevotella sp.]|nr:undecaprenyl/decaprenyl-phosphate alpha-N-acetylglucosaminyl 1-phosphate transferase [Prevotella sp.]
MNQYILYFSAAFLLSAACGFVSIPLILDFCKRKRLYDIPNERKVHANAIPRLGGICFMPSMLLAFIGSVFFLDYQAGLNKLDISLWTIMFFISLMLIYVTGIIDDIIGLKAQTKFIVQVVAACFLPLSNLYINNFYGFLGIHEIPYWLGFPLTVFIIVFIDNAINLIDGIDGLAGGLSLLALGGFLYCFSMEGLWAYSILIAGLMGVLGAFLYFNIWGKPDRNTKLFMGDSGSLTLGFILGFLFVKFAMDNPNVMPYRTDSLMLSLTLLTIPMFDVVRVTFVRLIQHKPLFSADKNHIHHRLMKAGLNQHQTLITILLFALAYTVINLFLYEIVGMLLTWIILIDIVIYVLFHRVVSSFIATANATNV